MKKKYELKERARRQAQTRQRIVDAAVALHTSVGPARTTISAIASGAGVERHTVYAHFPDELVLFRACSSHWKAQHPLPDFEALATIEDPPRRLRRTLTELYEWYESVEAHLALFVRDAPHVAGTAEALEETTAVVDAVRDSLARDWPRRRAVVAGIGHALEFETWRSLVRRQGLARAQAVDAMLQLVASL